MNANRWRLMVVSAMTLVQIVVMANTSISGAGRTALAAYLSAAVKKGDVPGVVALIVDDRGVLYEQAAGYQDVAQRRTMRTDAIFRIASMTKPITTTAAMMLVEEGKIGLDDPVARYLPAFGERRVISTFNAATGTAETRPAKRVMTIRHLMSHTSGLGYAWSSPVVASLTRNARELETEIPLLQDPGE